MSIGIFLLFVVRVERLQSALKAGTIRVISDSYSWPRAELGASLRFGTARIIPLLLVTISKGLLLFILYMAAALVVGLMFFLAA